MPSFVDLSGARFGRLLVVEVSSRAVRAAHSSDGKSHGTVWKCRCDCGNEVTVTRGNLKNGSTSSCGCLRNTQGGLSRKHRLWKRWDLMISRCTNPSDKDFKNYGGRGIKVCRRWMSFPNFIADMDSGYFEGATLERTNNNGPYAPRNVKWATTQEQSWNQRKTAFIDTPWGRMSRGEAASRAGVPIGIFISRVKQGWSMDRLFDPANREKMQGWTRRIKRVGQP